MPDPTDQLVVPLALIAAGLALLTYALWARSGRSGAARHWLPEFPGENWQTERIVTLLAPACGLLLICISLIALPIQPEGIRVAALIAAAPLSLLVIYGMLPVIPIHLRLYPRWAREPVARRRAYLADQKRQRRASK